MIGQSSDAGFEVLDWVLTQVWAVGPLPAWMYPLGWACIGLGAAALAFLAGAAWGSGHRDDTAPPAPSRDVTAVLPRVEHSPVRLHRRGPRFALPRRASTTRALSGTSRSTSYAPGKAAPRR
ncbi:hypothetical protein [Micromonospora sp. RV43]|uniref:hypothetical protein n=1 Tax=Micromonospora sp. RV43 TaxID=1661387 RepID=UPI00064C2318|nr:hypothetical protein [Micromonospora sp. RV43]